MKKKLFLLFHVLPVLVFGQGGGILIKPAKIDFTVDRGQTATQTLFLQNSLNKTMQFKVYLNDWLRDSSGGHKYMSPGTNEFSCARWVKLDQEFVQLAPGESRNIVVTITLPDSAEASAKMRWAMVFVETAQENAAPAANKNMQTTINQIMRMGIHIYQTPPGITTKDMRMLSFENVNNNVLKYKVACQNTGTVQIECKSYLEVLNLATGAKTKIDNPVFPMFPGQKRFINFDLPASLQKGKYILIAAVDAGEDVPLEAAQKTIEIK